MDMPFTAADRSIVLERVLDLARSDERVTGGALVGSSGTDTMDSWSDLDATFGIATGVALSSVLDEWTAALHEEFEIVHHFDVFSGPAIYRVILFQNLLELDLSVAPENEFGAKSPSFRLLFGKANQPTTFPKPSTTELIGYGWHHILHANAAISRGRYWNALFWINGLRDNVLALKSIRHNLPLAHARGAHSLPQNEIRGLDATLVEQLEKNELRRALKELGEAYLEELGKQGEVELSERLRDKLGVLLSC